MLIHKVIIREVLLVWCPVPSAQSPVPTCLPEEVRCDYFPPRRRSPVTHMLPTSFMPYSDNNKPFCMSAMAYCFVNQPTYQLVNIFAK